MVFSVPKFILLCNHKEYPAPNTIPQAAAKVATWERLNKPMNTRISPTKLLVPGNPIFAKEKNKKKAEKAGITWVNPP